MDLNLQFKIDPSMPEVARAGELARELVTARTAAWATGSWEPGIYDQALSRILSEVYGNAALTAALMAALATIADAGFAFAGREGGRPAGEFMQDAFATLAETGLVL